MRRCEMKVWVWFLVFWCLVAGVSWAGDSGFTEEDRARLVRLEATLQTFMHQVDKRFEQVDKRFEELRQDMNKRFEQVDRRFEELRQDMNKGFDRVYTFLGIITGIFTALTVAVIGFAYWDRRTILRRASEEAEERLMRGKLGRVLEVLRERAKEDRRLAEIMRSHGLL